ncbi:glycosyltransferase family 39 protein [Rhodocyclus tenuis]|uniref:Glycosyltransferase family 39 protein n=1 Tax=Rhodocyclus gracilis TaxID=2929842 RepID=A0ABX0WGR7_9RHOO|nr:glycosyltransferase family 39 protein [Rhodocyclus gracilis]NJA88043.1 glycosyltransferase family 39 protein [Rhodocyclus gracilis]
MLLTFAVVWFGTLDYRKLIQPDEGRYAEIAREMVVSGDYVTPRLNGLKYFEKPALQYWITAGAFKTFGEHDWVARFWPGLSGFLSVLLAFFTAQRLFGPRAALLGTVAFASTLFVVLIGHINTLDMGLSFFLQLALSGMLLANRDEATASERRRWMLIVWVALAGAMLSKGLIALVLCGGTLVVYSLLARDFSPWRRLELLRGIPLFLLLVTPWFVAVSLANPEFFHFFFIHEHFERFLTKAHGRYQPAWYFFAVLLLGALPWTLMLLQGWLGAWFRERRGGFQPQRFLVVWAWVILLFFSASSSKLPSYILPMVPALAMLTGVWLARVERRTLLVHMLAVVVVALVALYFAPSIVDNADAETPLEMMSAYARWATVAAYVLLAGAVGGTLLVAWRRLEAGILLLSLAGLLSLTIVIQGHENFGYSNSSYHLAQDVKPVLPPDVPFYSVGMYEQTLPYYLKRTLTLVNYRDELSFGIDQQPELWVPSFEEFRTRWIAGGDAFAVMSLSTYTSFVASELPMEVVARDTRRIVVRRPQTDAAPVH